MGIFQKIFGKAAEKAATVTVRHYGHAPLYDLRYGDFEPSAGTNDFFEEQAYGSTAIVFMVVDKIASKVSSLPIEIVGTGPKNAPVSQARFDSIIRQFHPKFSEFLEKITTSYLVSGEAFAVKKPVIGFEESTYITPRPSNVTITEDREGLIRQFTINYYNATYRKTPEDVLHIKRPNITTDNHRGMSPLQAMRFDWQASRAISQNDKFIHERHGANAIVFSKGGIIASKEEQERLQSETDKTVNDVSRVGRLAYIPQELGKIDLGIKPKDLDSVASQMSYLRTISAAYGVPSQLLNDDAASTYNNMQEATKAFILNAVLPVANKILSGLSEFTLPAGLKFVVDKDQIPELNIINSELSQKVIAELQAGILNAQEAKEILYPETQKNGN